MLAMSPAKGPMRWRHPCRPAPKVAPGDLYQTEWAQRDWWYLRTL